MLFGTDKLFFGFYPDQDHEPLIELRRDRHWPVPEQVRRHTPSQLGVKRRAKKDDVLGFDGSCMFALVPALLRWPAAPPLAGRQKLLPDGDAANVHCART